MENAHNHGRSKHVYYNRELHDDIRKLQDAVADLQHETEVPVQKKIVVNR